MGLYLCAMMARTDRDTLLIKEGRKIRWVHTIDIERTQSGARPELEGKEGVGEWVSGGGVEWSECC